MKTKYTILLYLIILTNVANAGDTIFNTAPVTRSWNPQYLQRIFRDEFSGTHLNTAIWSVDLCKSRGWYGNNEGEPNNITVSDSTLKLTARYLPGNIDNNCYTGTHFVSDYTTAEIWTDLKRYKYGSFEARCNMPRGDHYFYGYWLWGPYENEYPQDGYGSEIDIAEHCEWKDGTNHQMKSTFHYWTPQPDIEIQLSDETTHPYGNIYEGAWHIYKIIWNPYEIIFYVDSVEVWRRSRYYTGADLKANDVGMNQIIPNVIYHERAWFPNDKMGTALQMHNTKWTPISDLPATMIVDYVRVSKFFLSPVITVPSVVCSTGTVILDVDQLATNISWQLTPTSLFATLSGSGKTANIIRANGQSGYGNITYTFQMPSGETFTADKEIIVGSPAPKQGTISVDMDAPPMRFTAFVESVPTATSYNWYLNGVLNNTYHGTSAIFNRANPACGVNYRIEVQAINPCGTSAKTALDISEPDCLYSLQLSPNLTTNDITIELSNERDSIMEAKVESKLEWELEVYNPNQLLKMKKSKLTGKEYKIATSGWEDGVYIFRVKIDNQIISEKLGLKH